MKLLLELNLIEQQSAPKEYRPLTLKDENIKTIRYTIVFKQAWKQITKTNCILLDGKPNAVYLWMNNKVIYLFHSNYIDRKVMLEKTEYSTALQSNIYDITKISRDEGLLGK